MGIPTFGIRPICPPERALNHRSLGLKSTTLPCASIRLCLHNSTQPIHSITCTSIHPWLPHLENRLVSFIRQPGLSPKLDVFLQRSACCVCDSYLYKSVGTGIEEVRYAKGRREELIVAWIMHCCVVPDSASIPYRGIYAS